MPSRSRAVFIGLIACAALVVSAPLATAADVTVVSRDGKSQTFDLAQLAGEFDVSADYVIRSTSGATQNARVSGISVRRLLELADADPAYSKVEIGGVRMTRTQIEGSGAVPAIYPDGGKAAFIRTSYGPGDANGRDLFSAGSITVKQAAVSVSDGPIATATASKQSVKPNQSVTFSARVTNTAAGEQFTYRWNFDDGTTATGASVKHKFKKRGTYRVLLTATPVGESTSVPAAVQVQVGAATKSKKKRTGTGTNDAAGAPLTGAADGDSGAGEQAATDSAQKPRKRAKKRKQQPLADPDLEVVSGELMSASTPVQPQTSTLAARSGNEGIKLSNGFEISGPAMAGIFAILLALAGLIMEYNLPQRLRRRLRGVS